MFQFENKIVFLAVKTYFLHINNKGTIISFFFIVNDKHRIYQLINTIFIGIK